MIPPPQCYNPNLILYNGNIWVARREVEVFDVAEFLQRIESPLLRFQPDANSVIKRGCRNYLIAPQWVLATLQKESSLLHAKAPTARQLDRAMGYGIPDSGKVNQAYATFEGQIMGACSRMRQYATPSRWPYVGGNVKRELTIDGTTVTPRNLATAACYRYTPHLHGNKLLWQVYARYFGGSVT